ncbi:hypothetical protein KAI87_15375, partial [Myxococcota bacterium]|nr:hypothetical protein [Myxococcota bacterium]
MPSAREVALSTPDSHAAKIQSIVRQKTDDAVDSFVTELEDIFRPPTAQELAEDPTRHSPQSTNELTDDEQSRIAGATLQLLKDMPVGALSPSLARGIKDLVGASGGDDSDIETRSLNELGEDGRQFVKRIVKEFRDENPKTYWAIIAGGVGGLLAYSYQKGTGDIEKLGIKPKATIKLFNNSVAIRTKGRWDAKFANADLKTDIKGRWEVGSSDVKLDVASTTVTDIQAEKRQKDIDGEFAITDAGKDGKIREAGDYKIKVAVEGTFDTEVDEAGLFTKDTHFVTEAISSQGARVMVSDGIGADLQAEQIFLDNHYESTMITLGGVKYSSGGKLF